MKNKGIYTMAEIICIVVLVLLVLFLMIRIFIIKGNVREIQKELKNTREEGYNRQMRVTLADRDLENLAAEINRNLDHQKKLKMETEQSRRQLEQSISDIAHDLRTPLTVVKGNLQMLESEDLSPKGREYLEISRKKSETLKSMVDEFFELSVLESDSKTVELCKLDLIGFLSEFVIENETLIREKNLTPIIYFPEKTIYVKANREMLSRVFGNLITNILKYAKDDFELSVSEDLVRDESGKNSMVSVKLGNHIKDGEAIDVDRIFDRTYRADKARSTGSAGLGLYIAKLLVEKQKGTISARIEDSKLLFDINLLNAE